MFERFTGKARQAVVSAQRIARERAAQRIRSEHLLAGLLAVPDNLALAVLESSGVRREDLLADLDRVPPGEAPPDADALATLGIDLDEVRRQVEDAFGPGALDRTRAAREGRWTSGHIPFDRDARKVMQLALREALLLKHNYIGCEHILLGMLHPVTGAAHAVLDGRGLRQDAARTRVEALLRGRRAG